MSSPGRMLTSADGTLIYADAIGDPTNQLLSSYTAFDAIFDDPKWSESLYLIRHARPRAERDATDASAWESRRLAEDFDAVVDAFGLAKPFVLAWSLGGTHLVDILSLHPGSYLSGVIHLAGVPYMASVPIAGTPLARSCLAPLAQTTDVVAYQEAAIKFAKGCAPGASWNVITQVLGQMMMLPPAVTQRVIARTQDEKGFLKAGAEGLPFLSVGGDEDILIDWKAAAPLMDGFTNKKFVEIKGEGADHIPWLTRSDEMRGHIVSWIEEVGKSPSICFDDKAS
ncbi:alpha/beta-hydrolase [Hymenopellis radicata]|nr:alpha/beta-hydrolase [Hymenopellis radicata]